MVKNTWCMCLVIPEEIDFPKELNKIKTDEMFVAFFYNLCITRCWSTLPLKYTFKSSWCTCRVIKIACETNTTPLKNYVTYFHLVLERLYIIDYLIQHHSFSCDLHHEKKFKLFLFFFFSQYDLKVLLKLFWTIVIEKSSEFKDIPTSEALKKQQKVLT